MQELATPGKVTVLQHTWAQRVFVNSIVTMLPSPVTTTTTVCHCSHSILNLFVLLLYYMSLCNCFMFCVVFCVLIIIVLLNACALQVFSCSMFRVVLQTCVHSGTLATLVLCHLCLRALVAVSQFSAAGIPISSSHLAPEALYVYSKNPVKSKL